MKPDAQGEAMPNIELLEKTMQYIKDHPEQHNQELWCGTAQCFAGWAACLSGKYDLTKWQHGELAFLDNYHPSDVGRHVLGLNYADARELFQATNTVNELELMVKDLCNGEHIAGRDYEGA